MPTRTDAEMMVALNKEFNAAIRDCEEQLGAGNQSREKAIEIAVEAMQDAIESIRTCAFGIIDARTSALHKERQRMVTAKAEYMRAAVVLSNLK